MAGCFVTCEGCGAVCNTEDGCCKSCWKKLPNASEDNDGVMEGIGHSDWRNFIEKNTDYYMPIFQKNEGKNVFISMNWAAFFLGNNWLFYRKMYKIAIACCALSVVAMALFALLFSFPHVAEVQALQETISVYEEYLENGGEKVAYTSSGDTYTPEIVLDGSHAKNKLTDIRLTIGWHAILATLVLQPLVMGLFGNAIYKAFIKKRIHEPHAGGASISSLIFGWVLFDVIEMVIGFLLSGLILMIGA